jgi:hypothetical protein
LLLLLLLLLLLDQLLNQAADRITRGVFAALLKKRYELTAAQNVQFCNNEGMSDRGMSG